jgi:Zinc-binding dehydrogenase
LIFISVKGDIRLDYRLYSDKKVPGRLCKSGLVTRPSREGTALSGAVVSVLMQNLLSCRWSGFLRSRMASRWNRLPRQLPRDLPLTISHILSIQSSRMISSLSMLGGGTGLLTIQMAMTRGARVITTVSTEQMALLARGAGADEIILYTRESFSDRVRELTSGAGLPAVYDSVGKSTFEQSLACLSRRGLSNLEMRSRADAINPGSLIGGAASVPRFALLD